jgi:hypothetical protein
MLRYFQVPRNELLDQPFAIDLGFRKGRDLHELNGEYNMGLPIPVELSDAELDVVSAGQTAIGNGLVAVAANVDVNDVLSHNNINVTLTNVANDVVHNVGVGVAVAAGILAPAGAGNFIGI